VDDIKDIIQVDVPTDDYLIDAVISTKKKERAPSTRVFDNSEENSGHCCERP